MLCSVKHFPSLSLRVGRQQHEICQAIYVGTGGRLRRLVEKILGPDATRGLRP